MSDAPHPNGRIPVRISVLTVSDTRTEADDTSGALLVSRLTDAGHVLHDRLIVPDDVATLEAATTAWIDDPQCDVVIATGGTGITGRDVTVDVFERLYTKAIVGFGELFRALSYEDIGPSTIQSRASGGLAGTTLLFAPARLHRRLPPRLGRHPRAPALDSTSRPCNLVQLMPRFG